MTSSIAIAEYDPAWPARFERIRTFVGPAVACVAVRIEHVGSTSVPGLAAKPIIDVDVVVESSDDVATLIAALEGLGYRWEGDLGVAERQAFAAPPDADLSDHHLYGVVDQSRPYLDHVLLRELLRSDPEACKLYAACKRESAARSDGDLDRYVALKSEVVATLLKRARAERGLPPVTYWHPDVRSGPTTA
jgi:GrpB-like predicted nucleotidyltransferase (UPF0157 family)